jgi:hypothetical protein
MSPDFPHIKIVLIVITSIISTNCYSQLPQKSRETTIAEVLQYTNDKSDADQLLLNGRYYENKYRYALGHPFLLDNVFLEGELVLGDKLYRGIPMKFDIYSQELIIQPNNGKQIISLYPPGEFIKSFIIYGKTFEKRSYNNESPTYYQVVVEEDQIACLYFWSKTRDESNHNISFSSYRFGESKHNNFLIINKVITQYRNNNSFKKAFPEQIQTEISSYLRSGKISIKKASDEEMRDLIKYSQNLLKGLEVR